MTKNIISPLGLQWWCRDFTTNNSNDGDNYETESQNGSMTSWWQWRVPWKPPSIIWCRVSPVISCSSLFFSWIMYVRSSSYLGGGVCKGNVFFFWGAEMSTRSPVILDTRWYSVVFMVLVIVSNLSLTHFENLSHNCHHHWSFWFWNFVIIIVVLLKKFIFLSS